MAYTGARNGPDNPWAQGGRYATHGTADNPWLQGGRYATGANAAGAWELSWSNMQGQLFVAHYDSKAEAEAAVMRLPAGSVQTYKIAQTGATNTTSKYVKYAAYGLVAYFLYKALL